ncbi:MAG: 4Fe-4S binding protein, partial [Spirochaetaceae bacterium]|nr:4Fe-4S binding protein [Spirochaetaceae bacterium]
MIRIGTKALGLAVAATIFGGIALSAGLGLWKTQGSKDPAVIKSGEFAGLPSPSDIRGSYTWTDVGKAFGIPAPSLVRAFGAGSETEKANSLEAKYGEVALPPGTEIGTDSVRLFVALYTGLPHEPEADTILPMTAIEVLRAEAKGDRSRIEAAALKAYSPEAAKAAATAPAAP